MCRAGWELGPTENQEVIDKSSSGSGLPSNILNSFYQFAGTVCLTDHLKVSAVGSVGLQNSSKTPRLTSPWASLPPVCSQILRLCT